MDDPRRTSESQHIHVVPLTTRMMEVLRKVRARHPSGGVVFPASRKQGEPMEPRLLTRAVARICERHGLPKGSPHDFRRSGATTLIGRYHVNRVLAGLILGHTIKEGAAATSVYDRYSYLPEKHRALEMWGDHLAGLEGAQPDRSPALTWFGASYQ